MAGANATIVVVINGTSTAYSWTSLAAALEADCKATGACLANPSRDVDVVWVLFGTLQILLLLIGLAFRATLGAKLLHVASLATLVSFVYGFALAFGAGDGFIGHNGFALSSTAFNDASGLHLAQWFQQLTVSLVLTMILALGLERLLAPSSLAAYIAFVLGVVHPPVAHAVWASDGWLYGNHLFGTGVVDLSGSAVLHVTAGAAVGVISVLLRRDRSVVWHAPVAPHRSLATLFIWIGWYGLIYISTPAIHGDCATVSLRGIENLTVAAATSGLLSSAIHWHWRLLDDDAMHNGVLSGLVAISASTSAVHPLAAALIGAGAAVLYAVGTHLLYKWDVFGATTDVVVVHLGNGLYGILIASLCVTSHRLDAAFKCSWATLLSKESHRIGCGLWEPCENSLGAKLVAANVIGGSVILLWTTALCTAMAAPLVHFGYLHAPAKDFSVFDDMFSMTSDIEGSTYHDLDDEFASPESPTSRGLL
ncbi:hypothetical protein SDRG_10644 [Saprolegnia diclina VS20]|uniref:Ammonium transporter AmtB-like domain-containing protein n=1 Tax=Saprolegnia diclina (strain VS20) TaxID=1156394 RepID=T0QE64_SAPDV|nr:hypothetical protein SDRG_10644 [Saprolegnia diclina VS20]EQC31860.1 hypothetical protein SDRG_10644 [Saprolegnia diclina VS20]|eukprot:XP_008614867.1 hypothetical protein SDRG_10644 [Saprolegnia diclina VS20]